MAREQNTPIGVAVVHPEPLVRLGLRQVLEAEGAYTILVEVAQHAELAKAWVPGVQVVLLHLCTPLAPVLEALNWVRHHKRVGAVVLGPVTEPLAERLVVGGAQALLPCCVDRPEVQQAVAVAARGGLHANAWMLGQVRGAKGRRPGTLPPPPEVRPTRREGEVLRLMADPKYYTLQAIADRLKVGRRTVETYRDALHRKYKVNCRRALLEQARTWGHV